jgi:hypothetical protein
MESLERGWKSDKIEVAGPFCNAAKRPATASREKRRDDPPASILKMGAI